MKRAESLDLLMKNLSRHETSHGAKNLRIFIDKELSLSKQDKKIIANFCKLCFSALELEDDYECYLSANRHRAKIVTTAICDFSKNNIRIYCHERAMADILRSIAHEMFHLKQHEMGILKNRKMKKHYLEPIEWDANIAAGSLLSYYAQKVGKDKIYR